MELNLDRRIAEKARKIATKAGLPTLQAWLNLVVTRAVQDAGLYR